MILWSYYEPQAESAFWSEDDEANLKKGFWAILFLLIPEGSLFRNVCHATKYIMQLLEEYCESNKIQVPTPPASVKPVRPGVAYDPFTAAFHDKYIHGIRLRPIPVIDSQDSDEFQKLVGVPMKRLDLATVRCSFLHTCRLSHCMRVCALLFSLCVLLFLQIKKTIGSAELDEMLDFYNPSNRLKRKHEACSGHMGAATPLSDRQPMSTPPPASKRLAPSPPPNPSPTLRYAFLCLSITFHVVASAIHVPDLLFVLFPLQCLFC